MCGRFVSSSPPDQVARYFDAEPPAGAPLGPTWNVAPTTDVHVVLVDGGTRRLAAHHWGLVPPWAKTPAVGNRMINARAEGLADRNAFRRAYRSRRCIVPADGFYEWQALPGGAGKQPWYVHRPDGEPLAFAGLWEQWRDPRGDGSERLRSTTIVTTTPNEVMAPVHDRMPVILPPSAWERWLDPATADLDALGALLVPAPPELITRHPVATDVGNVRNDGPHLIDPVAIGTGPG